jgi:two-component system, NtrC family, response regulator AtoC
MARILILEDDEILRDLLAMYLEMEGHVVTTAADGGAGLSLLRNNPVDLIVLDLMMPEMDGSRFLAALQTEFANPPRVIVLSAAADHARAGGLDRAGASLVLVKPVKPEVLQMHVARLLETGG